VQSKLEKLIDIMEQQEQILQFPHFNRQDAWDPGHVFGVKAPALPKGTKL
jgi:uncharacterized protein (UPF0303 family)